MKRVLITGASGFVGRHLVPHLHEKKFAIWATYYRHPRKFPFQVHWLRVDLTRYQDALEVVRWSRPHYVIHLAAQTRNEESWKRPNYTYELNVGGTVNLLEGVARLAPLARVIIVSSSQVYGTAFSVGRPVTENEAASPLSPYAGSKLLMEMAGLNYFERWGIQVVIARPTNQIGQGQGSSLVFSDFCHQVALMEMGRKPPALQVGDIDIVRDFIHVEDVARAYWVLATQGKAGEIYNVGRGKGVLLRRAVDVLKQESRVAFKLNTVDAKMRRNDLRFAVLNGSKLRKLGWRPRTTVWDGLREVLQEWRQRVREN